MAHIPDGVLSAPVLIGAAAVSAGLLAVALRRLDEHELPRAAVLAAAFFVSSLAAVPLGPSSVHLLLNGLMGLLLGWTAVPALLIALLLQAVFFGHGGLLVLGANLMNLAVPALVCALLLRAPLQRLAEGAAHPGSGGQPREDAAAGVLSAQPRDVRRAFLIGAAAGALGALLTGLLVAGCLTASGEAFWPAARLIALSFVPLALLEAAIAGVVVAFLLRVEPAALRLGAVRHG